MSQNPLSSNPRDPEHQGLRTWVPLPPAPTSRAAHRVRRFIVESVTEPLSVARIATASGLSERTLHRVVRREYGMAPIALLRRERLARARTDLEAPAQDTTVTEVALSWGFTDLGRFAHDYAKHFGERPSDTLRRARGRPEGVDSGRPAHREAGAA